MILNNEMMLDKARLSSQNPLERKMEKLSSERKGPSFENTLEATLRSSGGPNNRPVDKELMKACVEYESIFVARMLSAMRDNIGKDEWIHGGQAEEIFEDMLYDEYAHKISKNSKLGLAEMLYGELSGQRG